MTTAAKLIEILQTLPPDTLINVSEAYGWSPSPIEMVYRSADTPGVILINETYTRQTVEVCKGVVIWSRLD